MPGYDALVQAVSGMMSFTGSPGTPTVRLAPSVLDLTTGMWAAIGLLAAILRRNAGGGAEHVRPSLIDSAFTLMNHQLLAMLATGQPPGLIGPLIGLLIGLPFELLGVSAIHVPPSGCCFTPASHRC